MKLRVYFSFYFFRRFLFH